MIQSQQEIIKGLSQSFQAFSALVDEFSDEQFMYAPEDRWTAGQHLEHLIKSTKPLNQALGLPRFLIRMLFGKPNRNIRDFDAQTAYYQSKLAGGAKASGQYKPEKVKLAKKQSLLQQFNKERLTIEKKVAAWSEDDLDNYLLPHPLMGKLSVREMLFFTIYHTRHHLETLQRDYSKIPS